MPDYKRKTMATSLYRESLSFLGSELQYEKAERKLRLAARLNDKDEVILNQLGYVLYEQGKHSESLKILFESLNKVDSSNIGTKTYIGLNYLAMKNFEEARDTFIEVSKQAPDSSDVFFNLGLAYKGLKNYLSAIEAFSKAARISPENAESYYELAVCLRENGDKIGARSQYEILLSKDRMLAEKLRMEIGIQ